MGDRGRQDDEDVEAMIAGRPLVCGECGRQGEPTALGLRAYVARTGRDDEVEVVTFCPPCARPEFGGD